MFNLWAVSSTSSIIHKADSLSDAGMYQLAITKYKAALNQSEPVVQGHIYMQLGKALMNKSHQGP